MTSGIQIIDGSIQATALTAADAFAAIAALVVPVGSQLLVGGLLRLLGLAALVAIFLGAAGVGKVGALFGPACVVILLAREIYWFGWYYKGLCAFGVAAFLAVLLLRWTALGEVGTSQALQLQPEVSPVGPPVALSFFCAASLFVTAGDKLLEPLGEDLEEEGERWAKRSSGSLYDFEDDEKK